MGKKNDILILQEKENNIRTKINEKKKELKKRTKKQIYNNSFNILNRYNINNFSFNEENMIKLEALKELVNNLKKEIDEKATYPDIEDLDLSYKLFHKKEFHQYRLKKIDYKGDILSNIERMSKDLCDKSGKILLSNPQKLLRNYISPYTPYNGVLVYHGVGVGKTCTAISIAEGLKEVINGNKKKIYVLVAPSIEDNFINEILNKKLIEKSIELAMCKCTGLSYFKDGKIEKMAKKKDPKKMAKLVRNLIREYYEFIGYDTFSNDVNKLINIIKEKHKNVKNPTEMNKIVKKGLKEHFSNCMIIIDEAHNISNRKVDKKKGGIDNMNYSLDVEEKLELAESKSINNNQQSSVNDEKSGVNDEKSSLNDNNSSLKNNKSGLKNNKSGLKNNKSGLQDKNSDKNDKKFDGKIFTLAIQNILKNADNLKLVLLTATPMYNEAYEIVDLLNLLLLNDKRSLIKQSDIFDKDKNLKEKGQEILTQKLNGYISYLRSENPINFPYKLYPFEYQNEFIKGNLYPKLNMRNERLNGDIVNHLNIIGCEMKGLQWNVYQKYYNDDKVASFDITGLQLSNIVFGENLDIDIEDISVDNYIGRNSFDRALSYDDNKNKKDLKFEINKDYENNFKLENLEQISCKLYNLISGLKKRMPDGIVFIYSLFKYAGIYATAIFLELMGVKNYNGKSILKNVKVEPLLDENGNQLKYLMKTGEESKEFERYKSEDEINNIDGSRVKFILGTKAASEGISILNVREIHILDPWYHINRIEQINGRGIRNCSHKLLDLQNRNVTIYMYAAIEPKDEGVIYRESNDLKNYKISEKKAITMGKVQTIVKSCAIDCYLNKEGNSYLNEIWDKDIDIIDARGNKIKYNLRDKPFTDICNYSTAKKCEPYKCINEKKIDENKIDDTTYRSEFSIKDVEYYQELIKEIFKKTYNENGNYIRILFKLSDIIEYIKKNDKMKIEDRYRNEILYFALDELINNETEIKDIYNRIGRLINTKNYYIFQPMDLPIDVPLIYRRIKYIPKYDKIILRNIKINKVKSNKNNSLNVIGVENNKKTKKQTNKELNDNITLFTRLAYNTEDYFFKEVIKVKKKDNLETQLDFLNNIDFGKEIVIGEYQYDHLLFGEKENIIKFLILKISEVEYNSDLLNSLIDLSNNKPNLILRHLNISLRNIFKINGGDMKDINNDKLNYLIKYCLFNHLEFNRDGNREIEKDFLGYRIYKSITDGRKLVSNLLVLKLNKKQFVNVNEQEKIVLESYHDMYRLSKFRNRETAEIYGTYFCDKMRFKIVDNRNPSKDNKRAINPGTSCNNSATIHSRILKPLVKILKDGKRLVDDSTTQKNKCLVMELFFRYKEYMSQKEKPFGKLYFFNQGLYGLSFE